MDGLSGQVPLLVGNLLVTLPHVRAGRLRAFGVTTAKRAAAAPEIPTIAEGGVPELRGHLAHLRRQTLFS